MKKYIYVFIMNNNDKFITQSLKEFCIYYNENFNRKRNLTPYIIRNYLQKENHKPIMNILNIDKLDYFDYLENDFKKVYGDREFSERLKELYYKDIYKSHIVNNRIKMKNN